MVKDLHEIEVDVSLSLVSTSAAFLLAAVAAVDQYVVEAPRVNTGPLIGE